MNKFLEKIAKSHDYVAYSKNEVKKATDMGAVEKLLVLDEAVRDTSSQQIMNNVENMGGKVMIISSQHDAGKQLESLGSFAAFLRYPI